MRDKTTSGRGERAAAPAPADALEQLKAAFDAIRGSLSAEPDADGYRELYVSCTDLLRVADARLRELAPGEEIDAEQLASVCMLLGPYRNLTTLTCSVLSLHPQCVVLNHAGPRTLSNPRLNFFAGYSRNKFSEFVRYAAYASRSGAHGQYGGDIRLSHGFGFDATRTAEQKLRAMPRGPAKSLVWKDSHLLTNFLRSAQVDVAWLLKRNAALRFMLPVRNPIDCAVSNLRTGHVAFFPQPLRLTAQSPLQDVVAAVLDEIAWFVALRERSGRPESFFLFFEHEIGRGVLERMLDFLGLPRDETYLDAAAPAFSVASAAGEQRPAVPGYAAMVEQRFGSFPAIRDALLRSAAA